MSVQKLVHVRIQEQPSTIINKNYISESCSGVTAVASFAGKAGGRGQATNFKKTDFFLM